MSGDVLPGRGWVTTLPIDELTSDYVNVIGQRGLSRRGNATAMGRFLEKVGAVGKKKPSRKIEVTIRAGEPGGEGMIPGAVVTKEVRRRHFIFFDLDTCRAGFEKEHGKQDWEAGAGAGAGAGALGVPG